MRQIALVIVILLAITFSSKITYAKESTAATSAALVSSFEKKAEKQDIRIMALENVFKKYDSPLTPYAYAYVHEADKNGVDWKLLPSIAGLESTFGKRYIEGTYNVYGWGSGKIYFKSWEDGISIINSAIRKNYMDKWGATNVWSIGPIYAESPTWAQRVNFFMKKIDEEYLAISISESLKPNL